MSYQCVSARFMFFDGKKCFTVEYAYGLRTWYVFEDEQTTGALWQKKTSSVNFKSPNMVNAENILDEYLETLS